MDQQKIFGLLATVSRLSDHCFSLCDNNIQTPHLSQNSKMCIHSCVQKAMESKNYVASRLQKEYPEAKKYNKTLEFTSLIDFT